MKQTCTIELEVETEDGDSLTMRISFEPALNNDTPPNSVTEMACRFIESLKGAEVGKEYDTEAPQEKP